MIIKVRFRNLIEKYYQVADDATYDRLCVALRQSYGRGLQTEVVICQPEATVETITESIGKQLDKINAKDLLSH